MKKGNGNNKNFYCLGVEVGFRGKFFRNSLFFYYSCYNYLLLRFNIIFLMCYIFLFWGL